MRLEAYSHRSKGNYEEAIESFQTLIENSFPSFWVLYGYQLALCHFDAGQTEEAIQTINRIQKIYGPYIGFGLRSVVYPRSYYLLGKIYESKGETTLAIENYEKLLELWKEADEDLPELIDAKERLAKLKTIG